MEWAGHVVRMESERMVKQSVSGKHRMMKETRKTKLRWLDCVEDDLKTWK
jgi:hypothetical protein